MLSILLVSSIVGCSSRPPDVYATLTEYLPERIVTGNETRAKVVLDFDDLGYTDELHYAMLALGFPAETVYTMFFGGQTGSIDGKGLVATWRADPRGSLEVAIEQG